MTGIRRLSVDHGHPTSGGVAANAGQSMRPVTSLSAQLVRVIPAALSTEAGTPTSRQLAYSMPFRSA